MHRIRPAMRSVLLGAAAAAIFVATIQAQSVLGPPGPANHFIATPGGWVHPQTAWGEPDIEATLNMMQAAGVQLERGAIDLYAGPRSDMHKSLWPYVVTSQRL